MTMRTAIDWTKAKYPWKTIGPEWATQILPALIRDGRPGPSLPEPEPWHRKLRPARLAAGLTQKEVGEMVGVCARVIGHWERGANPVPQRHHAALADILGVPIGDLL